MTKFNEYNLKPFLLEAIEQLGFKEPTAIQKEMIPQIMRGIHMLKSLQAWLWLPFV